MGRTFQPFKKEESKKLHGEGGIKQFFSVLPKPKKVGCPKKKRRGRKPKQWCNLSEETPLSQRKAPPESTPATAQANSPTDGISNGDKQPPDDVLVQQPAPKKPTRINWGKGDHRIKMEKTINDWLEEEGD